MILHALQSGEGQPVVLLHGLFGAARNFGGVQRALAHRFRVIALDMRNHGDSPHGADMSYPTQARDVLETLRSLDVGPAAVIGHSMGGKAAMALALEFPASVGRLLVADIAPVAYQHGNAAIADAMRAIALTPSLTRQAADTALAPVVPRQDVRAFLLQNLRFGDPPCWRIGLTEIAAAIADLEGWEAGAFGVIGSEDREPMTDCYGRNGTMGLGPKPFPGQASNPRHGSGIVSSSGITQEPGASSQSGHGGKTFLAAQAPRRSVYTGPTLFVTGANSDYVLPEHRPLIREQFPAARFVAVKNAGHWVHADNPAGFLSVLEAFLHDW